LTDAVVAAGAPLDGGGDASLVGGDAAMGGVAFDVQAASRIRAVGKARRIRPNA
jgi:hypothetical protein